jgi:DNA-binding XRE family transcriptional regulator
MPASVMLFSDRPAFEKIWKPAFAQEGVDARASAPADLAASVAPQRALVIDAASGSYDEDELLASLGLARAVGAVAAVHLPVGRYLEVEGLVEEICAGLVARTDADVARVACGLARRIDRDRRNRFEYVAVSPRGGELLAILGDGSAQVLTRPVGDADDGSEVDTIELSEDASQAVVSFAGGGRMQLRAAGLASRSGQGAVASSSTGFLTAAHDSSPGTHAGASSDGGSNGNGLRIDGARLGQRLRELRLAAGLTQAELARRTGIHRPNIARVEAGRHTPSLETLARLAQAIGVSTTRVLSDD